MKKYNWGIIAPGNIADQFCIALKQSEQAHLYSVASRSSQRAKAFATKHDFSKTAESYTDLINDPYVDVVYIASPHNAHMAQSIACLEAGKAVLCEKPMSINTKQANKVIDAAEQANVFYMEALWTRCLPVYTQIREWIEQGRIGDIEMIQASFGFSFADKMAADSRLLNIELAGGALLDMGIYPIAFAQWVMQQAPTSIVAKGQLGATGVDEKTAMILSYQNQAMAVLSTTLTADTGYDAWISGSKGRIKVPRFWCAESAELFSQNGVEKSNTKHRINGYEWEIDEVHNCLNSSKIESSLVPWQTSLQTMRIMDEVRDQIGLKYPMES